MTPSNLSIYVVFMALSWGINDVIPPIAKDIYIYIYGRAHRSANNKGKHACNACILKSTYGSTENRGIQSNQGVHVYGIWWIG